MRLHRIMLLAVVVAFAANAGNITLSSDTLYVSSESHFNYADTVTISNDAALKATLDSARILFYGINDDDIDFGNAYIHFTEHYEDERNSIVWGFDPVEGNENEFRLTSGPMPEPQRWPMDIYGSGDSIKVSGMRLGTCLECSSINLVHFSSAWLTLYYRNNDSVVINLVPVVTTSVRKATLPRPVNVEAQNLSGSFLLNGRLAPASLVKINNRDLRHIIVRDIKK